MSDESEDDYVEFGTPLEPLEEDTCPRKKPFTIEEQFARDKHGRRRFHGAFTGGFSAGFLNTVGSLEGWKPSTFKSSKSQKADKLLQKPEDFMDEEDVGEFGIAPSILHAKEDFSGYKSKKRKYELQDSSAIGFSILKPLLQPVRDTIGIKLLKKMGWRPGQGIGPRISKNEKQRQLIMRKKVYGSLLQDEEINSAINDDEEDDDSTVWENLTFAPDDYTLHFTIPKQNVFGIGYKGLEKRSILSMPQVKPEFQMKSKHGISGQAFGVGAFEEEDEDIYSREDMSQYDYSLGELTNECESSSNYISYDCLAEEFVLATTKKKKKIFPSPELPKDFKPLHKTRITRFENIQPDKSSKQFCETLMREDSSKENEIIQEAARKLTESLPSSELNENTFKPFISDIDKQNRYEKFLKLIQAGKKDALRILQPITMTEWEKEREMVEFQQAAKLFSPLTGIMKDRFITAVQPDDVHNPLVTVEKLRSESEDVLNAAKMKMYGKLTRTINDWKPSSILCKRFNVPELKANEIPVLKKPKYSIFDNLISLKVEAKDTNEDSENNFLAFGEKKTHTSEVEKEKVDEILENKNDYIMQDQKISCAKNKIDLFNEIFLDSDSEKEDEGKDATVSDVESRSERDVDSLKTSRNFEDNMIDMKYEETIRNDKRNMSPARGIFENLDSNNLFANNRINEKEIKNNPKTNANATEDVDNTLNANLVYGPKLPDKLSVSKNKIVMKEDANDDCWIEKTEHGKIRKKKSKHKSNREEQEVKCKKYKKSKHKSKYKHKEKKKKYKK